MSLKDYAKFNIATSAGKLRGLNCSTLNDVKKWCYDSGFVDLVQPFIASLSVHRKISGMCIDTWRNALDVDAMGHFLRPMFKRVTLDASSLNALDFLSKLELEEVRISDRTDTGGEIKDWQPWIDFLSAQSLQRIYVSISKTDYPSRLVRMMQSHPTLQQVSIDTTLMRRANSLFMIATNKNITSLSIACTLDPYTTMQESLVPNLDHITTLELLGGASYIFTLISMKLPNLTSLSLSLLMYTDMWLLMAMKPQLHSLSVHQGNSNVLAAYLEDNTVLKYFYYGGKLSEIYKSLKHSQISTLQVDLNEENLGTINKLMKRMSCLRTLRVRVYPWEVRLLGKLVLGERVTRLDLVLMNLSYGSSYYRPSRYYHKTMYKSLMRMKRRRELVVNGFKLEDVLRELREASVGENNVGFYGVSEDARFFY
jgi:hypothetical protein